MDKLRVLDLFSGIGGFSLGLERTGGFETVAFCEIEPFPRKVLAKHWPDVPCYEDVRELTAERLAADGIAVDVICGGFPCQDISFAGKGAGLAGERSGLFYEVARLVGELAPRFVILENVAALLSRGLGDVLGTLASLRYDAEWHCIPASYLGAHHRRDRVWIIAYANGAQSDRLRVGAPAEHTLAGDSGKVLADPQSGAIGDVSEDIGAPRGKVHEPRDAGSVGRGHDKPANGAPVAHAMRGGRQGQGQSVQPCNPAPLIQGQAIDAFNGGLGDIWRTEPDVGRVANGVPDRAHRLKALGNAIVPQIAELIGRAILSALQDSRSGVPSPSCAAGLDIIPVSSPNLSAGDA